MLRLIKNYTDERYIEDVLIELRELKDDSFQQDDFMEVIKSMSNEAKICPICGGQLKEVEYAEIHYELETHPKEYFVKYICEECSFDDSEN